MKTYRLVEKIEDERKTFYARMAHAGKKDCELIIDDNYYIERFIHKEMLYYVHVKDGRLMKVCVYERV